MIPIKNNARFTKIILIQALLCTIGGLITGYFLNWPLAPFLLIMGSATVALLFMIRMINILLDSELSSGAKLTQFLFFSFFKLVCLLFLAITLKRFQELSFLSVIVGATFYWMAPMIAGLFCSKD